MEAMIRHEILRWAMERAQVSIDAVAKHLTKPEKVEQWLRGEARPTFRQARELAKRLHIPFGYLFLSEPPEEKLPYPDFRTIKNEPTYHTSPAVIELLYDIERKQSWYHEYAVENGFEPVPHIGKFTRETPYKTVARDIRKVVGFDVLRKSSNKENYLYDLSDHIESLGILVLRSSYAGTGTQNSIQVEELRGLAVADPYAPLIFVNSSDTKSAQIFTIAHELAHLWIGQSGISDIDIAEEIHDKVEKYCNLVAAEILIPEKEFRKIWDDGADVLDNCESVARRYFVSKFVALKRAYDLDYIDYPQYEEYYHELWNEWERIKEQQKRSQGGNFYNSKPAKESKRLSRAVVEAAKEGRLLYADAMNLLNIKNLDTFNKFAEEVMGRL